MFFSDTYFVLQMNMTIYSRNGKVIEKNTFSFVFLNNNCVINDQKYYIISFSVLNKYSIF